MLQISGLHYTYDDTLEPGKRILDIYLENGKKIDPKGEYTITVNNFMAGGGDGYQALLKGKDSVIGPTDLEGFINYVKNFNGEITGKYENRIQKVTQQVQTGWVKQDGKWFFYNEDGVMQTGWVKSKGKWYFLDKDGVMQTGWYKENNTWYYLDAVNGDMKLNWAKVNGKWYFFNVHGAMQTGWVKDGTKWYFLDQTNGDMKTGWVFTGKKWYFLASSGAMKTGWVATGGKWYYLYSNGSMAANTTVGGYKVGKDGAWIK